MELELKFKKLINGGYALANYQEKMVFAYGVLPGELAQIKIKRKKKNCLFAEVIKILQKSKERIEPKENHYLSCSPWQILTYKAEIKWKKRILKEVYQQIAKEKIKINKFYPSPQIWHYRTKIEFSFTEKDGKIFLAFYQRENPKTKVILENGCELIDPKVNQIALQIVEALNQKKFKVDDLKSLVFRVGKRTNEILAALFVKRKNINFHFSHPDLTGFFLIYSEPQSPASRLDQILFSWGEKSLREKIFHLTFTYTLDSFFQNNIELFEKALDLMKPYLKEKDKILELYGGVGTIGISLASQVQQVTGVEILPSMVSLANLNTQKNKIQNYQAISQKVEKLEINFLKQFNVFILDPPRAGLSSKITQKILTALPEKIIYLSCNPATQARDYFLLKSKYQKLAFFAFDFYPRTPHLESLLVLEKS